MPALRLAHFTPIVHEIEVKKSRFITCARRVESVDDARSFITEIRAQFPDARHHCSAFVVSVPGANDILHSSDDGEPSGTAGRPMLDILTGFELTDVVAVVVRYFGGTLLGTGGLVRAYGDSVRECLLGTEISLRSELQLVNVALPHATAGKIEADLRVRGYDVVGVEYQARNAILSLAVLNIDQCQNDLAELTAGNVRLELRNTINREQICGELGMAR
ncbi:YigZ family protein [Arcanobacterium ihumii]|uniref:YigZ family protein n=1 Tax=Arcanobacterium ihumii TaxID=2138162 RepID=UPI000F51C61A|nr:YigZ family protein [Arcanobacterium ihumii]